MNGASSKALRASRGAAVLAWGPIRPPGQDGATHPSSSLRPFVLDAVRAETGAAAEVAAAAPPPYAAADPAGTSQCAPSFVHRRTMSRTESTPAISPPSTTTRWRKPRSTMTPAARSSDQSGDA